MIMLEWKYATRNNQSFRSGVLANFGTVLDSTILAHVLTLCAVADGYFKRRLLLSKPNQATMFLFFSSHSLSILLTHKLDSMKNEVANIRISIMTLIISHCKELWLDVLKKNPIYFFYNATIGHYLDQAAHRRCRDAFYGAKVEHFAGTQFSGREGEVLSSSPRRGKKAEKSAIKSTRRRVFPSDRRSSPLGTPLCRSPPMLVCNISMDMILLYFNLIFFSVIRHTQ